MKLRHTRLGTIDVPTRSAWAPHDIAEDERVLIIHEARFIDNEDQPVTDEFAIARIRARLLGTRGSLPPSRTLGVGRVPQSSGWLIPGLWPWGTIPMLGGNPKSGKTTAIADLAAALVVPGRKFMGHFDVGPVDHETLGRGVWLINAETPAWAFEDELERAGLDDTTDRDLVEIDHLEELGGAHTFDLTDPAIFDVWIDRLTDCQACDGTDFWTPFVVIVDGLTAILHAAGKGPGAYGLWYAAFRRLMRQLEVPNALVVAHNTLAGGHLMGGVEAMSGADGLWTYSSSSPENPNAARRFSVVPRLGGAPLPPTPVVMDANGLLSLQVKGAAASPVSAHGVDPFESVAAAVLDYVRRCNRSGHGPSSTEVRKNVPGRNPDVDDAVTDLVSEGLLEQRPRSGRGGGFAYWVAGGES